MVAHCVTSVQVSTGFLSMLLLHTWKPGAAVGDWVQDWEDLGRFTQLMIGQPIFHICFIYVMCANSDIVASIVSINLYSAYKILYIPSVKSHDPQHLCIYIYIHG